MSVTMIRGYGLPAAEAGSYNGLRGFEGHPFSGRFAGGSNRGLFNTLPDPELGGYGGFAGAGDIYAVGGRLPFGASRAEFYQDQGAALPTFTATQTREAAAVGGGMGTVALLGLGAVALFFIFR